MENKLEVLTKKLYDEGVEKARKEADEIINKANEQAGKIIADAEAKAKDLIAGGTQEVDNLKKKAESEMALSARQALTALKQSITHLISDEVAGEMAETGFEDKAFVQDLLISIVKKWDVTSGNLNLDIVLSPDEKAQFESFVAKKYKDLLDKGLEVKVGNMKEGFLIRPQDGSYQIAFSEELFEAFFNQYMRSFTKSLLYK
ncbi:V-type ATP synthase subunit E [uncultured Odoribacter sp.]|uniref:V-type ATP synthase subunit E n=1 Tax=uncultured Odoribacter sp. TaxID=876416 RepID=UPI002617953C|nr:V-type ATP synthase subunit E [uncultured Odoribacter sp.]